MAKANVACINKHDKDVPLLYEYAGVENPLMS